MGGFDHGRAAGGQNEVNVLVLHQLLGALQGNVLKTTNKPLRGASLDGGLSHQAAGLQDAFCRRRVGGDDDAITGFNSR